MPRAARWMEFDVVVARTKRRDEAGADARDGQTEVGEGSAGQILENDGAVGMTLGMRNGSRFAPAKSETPNLGVH